MSVASLGIYKNANTLNSVFMFKLNCIACLYSCLNTEEIYPLIKCHLKVGKIVTIEIRITHAMLLPFDYHM